MNVCTTWRKICKDPRKWLTIDMCDVSVYGELPSPYPMDKLCRKAIDLSCGNLVNISVHNFGSDDLLKHITDRGIKKLCIVYSDISNSGPIEAAPKLPLLEDLEISYCNYRLDIPPFNSFHCIQLRCRNHDSLTCGHARYLEVIGRCYPRLKSLKLNKYNNHNTRWDLDGWDGDAFAIAGTMQGLQHLQLFRNRLTSKGLRAILDACPLLESLDLY
ncbi:hypothetical protein ACLB2K_019856 [Fragaria x ananassa]